MATFDLKSYARRGAEARVQELQQELQSIYSAFPDLQQPRRGRPAGTNRRGAAQAQGAVGGDTAVTGRRKRKGMSAAQRKAVGERMRKYWAERRKKNK